MKKLCEVESDLTGVDESSLKEKNKRFWSRGELYLELAYQVKVIIGPADLRFQLCKYSSSQAWIALVTDLWAIRVRREDLEQR